MNNVYDRAAQFAQEAHTDVFRKDGITPYFHHCQEVAGEAMFLVDSSDNTRLAEVGAAGCLHDVVEDVEGIEIHHIYEKFGDRVGFLVGAMTEDTRFKPRAVRGLRYNYQILQAAQKDVDVLALKYADMWSNTCRGFDALRPSFRPVFASEALRSLDFFEIHAKDLMNPQIELCAIKIRRKVEEELDWLIKGEVSQLKTKGSN